MAPGKAKCHKGVVKVVKKEEKKVIQKKTANNVVEKRIEGKFKVGEIEEEQIIFRTHPSVTTKLLINGKETCFKVGILPKFPVKISANSSDPTCFIGGIYSPY